MWGLDRVRSYEPVETFERTKYVGLQGGLFRTRFDSRCLHHDCCLSCLYLAIQVNKKAFSAL